MKPPGGSLKRILIVEDGLAVDQICRRVLTGERFEADITVNGKIAQETIEDEHP